MRFSTLACAIAAIAAAAGSANAALTFSFADPIPGRQMSYSSSSGLISYDSSAVLSFLVDGSTEPNNFNQVFGNAGMNMMLNVGSISVAGPIVTAPVSGFFEIFDRGTETLIVRGDTAAGSFVRLGATSSILMSSDISFTYTAGPALNALLLPGRAPSDPQEAVFTVTDLLVTGGGPLVVQGQMRDWTANASMSGNTEVVPAPGVLALAGMGGLMVATRKRR